MKRYHLKATDISNFLLYVTSDECNDVTNMKINKMVYYAQGHAYKRGMSLFDEQIRAGKHGPIIEEVYHKYEKWGNRPIEEWDEENAKKLPSEIKSFLVDVASIYADYTPSQLRWITHQPNTPWDNNYVPQGRFRLIPEECIQEYFKNNVLDIDETLGEMEIVGYHDENGILTLPEDMR